MGEVSNKGEVAQMTTEEHQYLDEHDQVIRQMRKRIGTAAQELKREPLRFLRGGEGIEVDLLNHETNWYAGMFVMAVSTWGGPHDSGVDKWNRSTPEERAMVVESILTRKGLPLALEHPSFLFEVRGASRSAFDQIARARVGVTFASMGARDNPHANFEVIVPPSTFDSIPAREALVTAAEGVQRQYVELLDDGRSWQDARAVLPMAMMHRFMMNASFTALQNICAKRLQFCEQYDTVAVAWHLKKEVTRYYAMLGEALRPGCDFVKRCTYHDVSPLAEMYGAMFRACGRWPDPHPWYDFNESSTDPSDIESWVGPVVPGDAPFDWSSAAAADRHWFEQELGV